MNSSPRSNQPVNTDALRRAAVARCLVSKRFDSPHATSVLTNEDIWTELNSKLSLTNRPARTISNGRSWQRFGTAFIC